jgi:hypothetical protein
MSKQTAVEWLVERLIELEYDLRLIPNHINHAKAMEKEQLREMYLKGIENYDLTFKRKEQ